MTSLTPDERVEFKLFTHPAYTAVEARLMRFMMARVCHVLESLQGSHHPSNTQLQMREMIEPDGRYHRVLVIQPAQFAAQTNFSVVGFFGQRSFDADDKDSWKRDEMLFGEMTKHQGLLSYSTLELTNGDYANTILFTDEAAKNHWGRSSVHELAVREFSPKFYHSVRLYNGLLEAPVMEYHKLKLKAVKYFDYSVTPHWAALRTLE